MNSDSTPLWWCAFCIIIPLFLVSLAAFFDSRRDEKQKKKERRWNWEPTTDLGIIGSNIRTTRMHIDPSTNEGKREQNGMVALVEERIEAVNADALGISTAKLLHFIEVELFADEYPKQI